MTDFSKLADGFYLVRVQGGNIEAVAQDTSLTFAAPVQPDAQPEPVQPAPAPQPTPEPEPQPKPDPAPEEQPPSDAKDFASIAHIAPPASGEIMDFGGQVVSEAVLSKDLRNGVTYQNGIVNSPLQFAISDKLDAITFRNMTFNDEVTFRLVRGLMLDACDFNNAEIVIQGWSSYPTRDILIRNCRLLDTHHETPITKDEVTWAQHPARLSGIYTNYIDGMIFEENLVDQIAWVEGYDPALSIEKPMPPSKFSHGLYIQNDCRNVCVRRNVISRCASFGLQLRPGGIIEDNVFHDNNAGFYYSGDRSADGWGNRSEVRRNIVAHPSDKDAEEIGARHYAMNGWTPGGIVDDNFLVGMAESDLKKEISFAAPYTGNSHTARADVDVRDLLTKDKVRADHMAALNAVRAKVGLDAV